MASSCLIFNTTLTPKLEGSKNYETWKLLVTSSLEANSMWKFISGIAVLLVTYDEEKEHIFLDHLELYHTKMAQARNIIMLT